KANDGKHGYELWKSNGTSTGTALVNDIYPGSANGLVPGSAGSYPSDLTNVSGTLFFGANDGSHGFELWKSNGTSTGTALVNDIYPGANSSLYIYSYGLAQVHHFGVPVR